MGKRAVLEPFQLAGAQFLASKFHAANGDDPGLGKTVQAIHAAEMIGARTGLITCPASVRTNWYEHLESHFGHVPSGWDIISYNGAASRSPQKLRDKYDVWIGDEIHFCKNLESQRTQAIFGAGGLARRATYKWPLSGTMAPNGRPVELYPMLKALAPEMRGMSFAAYTQKYCGAYFDGRSWNVKGASRVDELAGMLAGFMVRRTKRQAFPGRKEPIISRVPLDLSADDLRAVIAEEDEILGRESKLSKAQEEYSQLGDTSRLLHLLGVAKIRHAVAFIEDLLQTVEKVVVFAHHIDVLDQLAIAFHAHSPVFYVGGMNDEQKDAARAAFKLPKHRIFLGQGQAAGTGINGLQEVCSTAVDVEPSWVPGETQQKLDRLDRMGSTGDIVNYYMLYARGTLDSVKSQVHQRKEETGARLIVETPPPYPYMSSTFGAEFL